MCIVDVNDLGVALGCSGCDWITYIIVRSLATATLEEQDTQHNLHLKSKVATMVTPTENGTDAPHVDADVLIVGGGMAGLLCALECKKNGFATIVLESKSSSQSAGKKAHQISLCLANASKATLSA